MVACQRAPLYARSSYYNACLLDTQGDGNVVLLLRDALLCREASIAYAIIEFVVCTVRARAYRHLRVASHRMHEITRA